MHNVDMPRYAPPADSLDRTALDRAASRMDAATRSDSPRAALTAARALGGPHGAPNFVALAASRRASRVVRELLAHGWPAEALANNGQNALWHAIASPAGSPRAGSLARELLQAGADPFFIGPVGSVFGEAASAGDTDLIELMLAARDSRSHGDVQRALSQGLWEASGVDCPHALAGCAALARAGADWAYEPKESHWFHDPENPGLRFNCAQHAAFTGSLDALADPAALAALSTRHPPRKGRGPWTGWRELVPPSRLPLVERWILLGESPPAMPASRVRL